MAEPQSSDQEGTQFNMAMLFYISLNGLMDRKDQAYIEGDLNKWRRSLRAIYRKINFKLKDDAKKKWFEDRFAEARDVMVQNIQATSSQARQMMSFSIAEAEKKLDEIDSEINIQLDKNNMIFPNLKNEGLGKVRKRFDLPGVMEK